MNFSKLKFTGLFCLWLLINNGCGTTVGNGLTPGTPIPNPNPTTTPSASSGVNVQFKSFTALNSLQMLGLSSVHVLSGNLTRLVLCIRRLRVKPDSNSEGEYAELSLGETTLSSSGTFLVNLNIPSGTYQEIEMDLDKTCSSQLSVQLTNGNGSYSTNDGATIKFSGTFSAVGGGQNLNLDLQPIISALANVTSNQTIKDTIETHSGDY